MMPFLGFIIAGVIMMATRLQSGAPFLNPLTGWVTYDVSAIALIVVGIVGLAIRLLLIFKAKH